MEQIELIEVAAMETVIPLLPPVQLDSFEGPLDVLLHLIRAHKMDIFDIPMALLTAQYLNIIDNNQDLDIDVAGEYLVMASTLMQLKSRMLLPRPETDEEGNDIDPRDALVAQLLAFEQYRLLAEDLDAFPRLQRDIFTRSVFPEADLVERPLPEADLDALLAAFTQVLKRTSKETRHRVVMETMSVREQMSFVTERLQILGEGSGIQLSELLEAHTGREAWVTTLLAILELWRQHIIQVIQTQSYAAVTLMLCPPQKENHLASIC